MGATIQITLIILDEVYFANHNFHRQSTYVFLSYSFEKEPKLDVSALFMTCLCLQETYTFRYDDYELRTTFAFWSRMQCDVFNALDKNICFNERPVSTYSIFLLIYLQYFLVLSFFAICEFIFITRSFSRISSIVF